MPKLDKKKMPIMAAVSLVIVAGTVAIIIYWPLKEEIADFSRNLKAVETQLKDIRSRVEWVRQIDKEAMENELLNLRKKLPHQLDISLVIDELTKAGKDCGIDFISIDYQISEAETPAAVEEEGVMVELGYQKIPIEIELQSRYRNFGEYLRVLEELPNSLFTIKRFQIFQIKEFKAEVAEYRPSYDEGISVTKYTDLVGEETIKIAEEMIEAEAKRYGVDLGKERIEQIAQRLVGKRLVKLDAEIAEEKIEKISKSEGPRLMKVGPYTVKVRLELETYILGNQSEE